MKSLHVFTTFLTPNSFFDGQFGFLTDNGEEIIVVSSYSDDALSFAERNNIRFISVDIPRSPSLSLIWKSIQSVKSIIKKESPDVVFGHTPIGALVALVAAKLNGVSKRVYFRHGLLYPTMHGVKRFIFKEEERFVSSLATSIINVSFSLNKFAISEGLNKSDKQFVLGHGTCGGIDTQTLFNPVILNKNQLYRIKKNLGLDNIDVIFGYCGRLCVDKGIVELVDAYELFKQKHLKVTTKLLLIGTMDDREGLPDRTMNIIKVSDDIIITGWLNKKDLPYYYFLLDCFVFPSYREGFGMSVIEASAMEVPVLCARSLGCEDAIQDGETGFYIKVDADDICKGMERVLDSGLRQILGSNGRRWVQERFDYKIMWPTILKFYQDLQ